MPPTRSDLATLFSTHKRHVYRRALTILGRPSDAEDITQDVFIKAMRGPELDGPAMVAWLYRVTTNLCIDRLRVSNRRRELRDAVLRPATTDRAERSDDARIMLRWLLANADERQARVATYLFVDELPAAQVAEVMGVSRRTVFNIVDRFRAWARTQTAALEAER